MVARARAIGERIQMLGGVSLANAVEWRGGHATHLAADLLVTSQAADF